MTKLYEIKDRVIKFCAEYETYLKYAYRFIVALILFCLINGTVGFMEKLNSYPVAFILAAVCCLFPQGVTLLVAAVLILLHLYVLSFEVAITALLLFVIIALLYFRFSPQDGTLVAITPIFHAMGIPYILPIGAALLRKTYSVTAVVCGTIVYYFLHGIYENVQSLQSTVAGAEVETAKMTITVGQLLTNKEMFLVIGIFIVASIVVRIVSNMAIDHAWKVAAGAGILVQVAGLLTGYFVLDISGKTLGMILGSVVCGVLAIVLEFVFQDLDYTRTERVQFEDDEYVYFVKAVPKKNVTITEKNITQFSSFPSFGKKRKAQEQKVSRKDIAEALDIDEDFWV